MTFTTPLPVNVLFGLFAALFWGGGDFSGGMGAKNSGGGLRGALRVILVSHTASLIILTALALIRGDSFPRGTPLLCALAAGLTGGLSLAIFYIALARGAMGTAAAVSGLLAAAVPAAVALVRDGSPGTLKLMGFVLAGSAIWTVAAAPTGVLEASSANGAPDLISRPTASTIGLAVAAGAGFGIYFVALRFAGSAGLFWPMATARIGSLTTCSLLLFFTTASAGYKKHRTEGEALADRSVRLSGSAILWALSTALLDTCGNLFYISATRSGRLDVAAVLASLYPATTILLAGLVLKERFSGRQAIGMALAAIAVAMITL